MSPGRHRHASGLWRTLPIAVGGGLVVLSAVLAVVGHDLRLLRLAIALSLAVAVFALLMLRGREKDHDQELSWEREDNRFEQERLANALADARRESDRWRRRGDERAHTVEQQAAALADERRRVAELESGLRTSEAARTRLAGERDQLTRQAAALRSEVARVRLQLQAVEAAKARAGTLPSPERFARAARVLGSLAYLRQRQAAAAADGAPPVIRSASVVAPRPAETVSVRSAYAPVPIGPTAIIPAIAAQLDAVARRTGTFPGFVDARRPGEDEAERPEAVPAAASAEQGHATRDGDALVDLTLHDETQHMDLSAVRGRRHA